MDIAVPGDSNILQKETEKGEKYQDPAREIQRIWKSRTKVVPVVVGALGSVSKKLAGHLEQLVIKNRTRTMQKSPLLGSAHILRKVLEVWGLGMRLDWIFLPRENPCTKFYVIITSLISTKRLYSLIYNVQYLKLSFPKIPLNFTLNTSKLVINWDSSGRLIHSLWPLKVNARWPAAVLQSGICRRSLFLVLQLCNSDLVLNFRQRYGGASPFKHLNTMVASLTALAANVTA